VSAYDLEVEVAETRGKPLVFAAIAINYAARRIGPNTVRARCVDVKEAQWLAGTLDAALAHEGFSVIRKTVKEVAV
jgi:hypothetical protein